MRTGNLKKITEMGEGGGDVKGLDITNTKWREASANTLSRQPHIDGNLSPRMNTSSIPAVMSEKLTDIQGADEDDTMAQHKARVR